MPLNLSLSDDLIFQRVEECDFAFELLEIFNPVVENNSWSLFKCKRKREVKATTKNASQELWEKIKKKISDLNLKEI